MGALTNSFRELAFGGSNAKAATGLVRAPSVYGAGRHGNAVTGSYAASTAKRQLEAYASGHQRSIDLVADCLEIITETASSANYHFEDTDGKVLVRERSEAEKHGRTAPSDLVELFAHPNPWMSYEELLELGWIDWLLTGDSFTLKFRPDSSGRPLALYRLAPYLIEVEPGEGGDLIGGYRYSVPGAEDVVFHPDDVVHLKRPNPHDPYRGAGLISAGPRIFDMEVALTETKANYFEQGTRLSGVLESDNSISPGLIESIRTEFAGLFAGKGRDWLVPVLQRGLHFKPMQGNAAEAEFVQMTEQSSERILAKFRVPRSKLGMPIESSSTTQPAEERRNFAQDVIRPSMNKYQTALSDQLTLPGWGLKYVIEYEYQMPIEDRIKLAGEFAKLPGITVKEARAFADLDPLEGDNAQFNDLVLNLPGEDDNASDVKDQPLPGEGGRPPNPENTRPITPESVKDADAAVR